MTDTNNSYPYKTIIRVTVATPEHAEIAMKTLSVDEELQKDRVSKVFTTDQCDVICTVQSMDARSLRLSVSSFFDMMGVVARTLRDFTS